MCSSSGGGSLSKQMSASSPADRPTGWNRCRRGSTLHDDGDLLTSDEDQQPVSGDVGDLSSSSWRWSTAAVICWLPSDAAVDGLSVAVAVSSKSSSPKLGAWNTYDKISQCIDNIYRPFIVAEMIVKVDQGHWRWHNYSFEALAGGAWGAFPLKSRVWKLVSKKPNSLGYPTVKTSWSYRLCWKCNCSCVRNGLKNKCSKFYKSLN